MNFSDLFNYLDKYGIGGFIVVLILFILITIFKTNWFSNLMSKLIDKKFNKKDKDVKKDITESDISNHDIIKFIDFWLYSKVPTFVFSTDYRTAVFRKYIEIYLKGYKSNINDFIRSGKFKDMDDAQILQSFLSLINNTIYDYESDMKKQGIPDIIIEKMKVKNNDTLSLTIDLILIGPLSILFLAYFLCLAPPFVFFVIFRFNFYNIK